MTKINFNGPLSLRISSFLTLNKIALKTYVCHALGKRMEPSWGANIEIGIRFCRHQFTKAMAQNDMQAGRAIFESVMPVTDDVYNVTVEKCEEPSGFWHTPKKLRSDITLLYLHGGGYTFNGQISDRFASMLAHHTGARIFAPAYRLTPEHPHPAQSDDALQAWHYVREFSSSDKIVVIGDSAGGHMALMLLQRLNAENLPQPALCIGICPWTDIGDRGASMRDNDQYDLVQGWMAIKFGQWLDPDSEYGREALSPISYDYSGLAPIYLLAGGREVLRDMIIDFAIKQEAYGADLMLDLWDDMPHNFLAYDTLKQSSTEALARIRQAVDAVAGTDAALVATKTTKVAFGKFNEDRTKHND